MFTIIRLIKKVIKGIINAFDALIWFITSLFNLIGMVVDALTNAVTICTKVIPTPLLITCTGVITIAVIYKIMGRE